MMVVPTSRPEVADARTLLDSLCADLVRRLGHGECPLTVAAAPPRPPSGQEHWHPWPELFLQCAGASRFTTPDGPLRVQAGGLLLFPPFSAHQEFLDSPQDRFCNLVLMGHEMRLAYHLALPSSVSPRQPTVIRPDMIETNDPLGLACLRALSRPEAPIEVRTGCLLALCGWIRTCLRTAAPPGGGSRRLADLRELVALRLSSPELSVARLAAWLGCHPDHLARQFRQASGETLVGYIQRQRLERARTLLDDPALSVADIAHLCGFGDPAYFSRVFRRRFGRPPSQGRLLRPDRAPAGASPQPCG